MSHALKEGDLCRCGKRIVNVTCRSCGKVGTTHEDEAKDHRCFRCSLDAEITQAATDMAAEWKKHLGLPPA